MVEVFKRFISLMFLAVVYKMCGAILYRSILYNVGPQLNINLIFKMPALKIK